ncbi:MAG: DUF1566 domain-containing protein [Candidatus Saccharibacteria bacterium]|nr:DUF1566 domain-containing protein [Candidatus Saccharibacteria bacterium]
MRILFLFLLTQIAQSANAQYCNSAITATAPNNRYAIISYAGSASTVLDKKTGLIWMRCALGQTWNGTDCIGAPQAMFWQTALQTAESTTYAGNSNWRLPNIQELRSLVEESCFLPAINSTIFPNTYVHLFPNTTDATTSGFYWSSTTVPTFISRAFYQGFGHNGGSHAPMSALNILNGLEYIVVRLVRDGQ